MKDSELQFDRKKHLLYSKAVKAIIQKHLAAHYPQQAPALWKEVQKHYLEILDQMEYMGGSKNMQAGSVYDCAALFAYCMAVPEEPSLEEFSQMNNELFLPVYRKGIADLNRPWMMKGAGCIFKILAHSSAKHREDWPGNYHMEMRPVPEGVKYVFLRCPIAELAKKLDYTHLMPAMCNPDYPMLAQMHAGLIRTTTCAFGDCCDFWIVGDKSPLLKEHPQKQDEAGYWYNEK